MHTRRFGNQADQFLGSLAFAKGLNRTLVLPPWIVYPSYKRGDSDRVPFDDWFLVKPLEAYHSVITMENFMKDIAPTIWPPGRRIGFCYSFQDVQKCDMKQGNPFGPFWDHFHIDFDDYQEHSGLLWDTEQEWARVGWNTRFPESEFPVIALMGAPGAFPVHSQNRWLQKFVQWSAKVENKAKRFISTVMNNEPFVGIHLRNGIDFVSVHRRDPSDEVNDPILDLAILTMSNHFIGNCVSSFTSFVTRYREVNNKPTSFWAFKDKKSKVEIDMDIDAVENELVPFEKSKMTPNNPGGPDAGNARHTVRSAAKSNGKVSEMEHSMLSIDRKESVELVNSANALKGGKECDKAMKPELKCVSGSKRPRSSAYVNEPCDSHAVDNKRLKTERNEQPKTELSYQEPMDISGLVNVFSSSFSGLSSIPRATPSLGSKLDSFQYLSPRVQPVGGVFGWSQTIVEAF
ncbi:GDP-fucose protein O-fucosyltransferase 1 [Stylophora pistillata]|uniref:GDP-fucose protein O-fucosyltransferase 1 n=1 Tax=Stylophora pistillata TaxID=50429 RepID=A0A2B4SMT4_STYPI|nr:GDP-fucose protein O-fucosyltransferase 1 [Stylophora pistillata]